MGLTGEGGSGGEFKERSQTGARVEQRPRNEDDAKQIATARPRKSDRARPRIKSQIGNPGGVPITHVRATWPFPSAIELYSDGWTKIEVYGRAHVVAGMT